MYQYDYDDDEGGSRRRIVVAAVAVAVVLGLGWIVSRSVFAGDDDQAQTESPLELSASAATAAPTSDSAPPEPAAVVDETTPESSAAEVAVATTDPEPAEPETTRTTAPPTTAAPPTTVRATTTTTTRPTTTTARPTTTTARPTTTTEAPATYETLPDGSPLPVIAVFDVSQITLTGAVPNQAAVERLSALALANSKTPATVVNQLTINPAVPINVGVRVIELTSARFPEGSAEIRPEHGVELDRVVTVMNALPNTSVLVVGHADQRGSELSNFVLSDERARAVVNHIAAKGITPSRLSARAVGENDLLTLNNDAAAFALNRRTEFVFYGLLIE